MNKTGLTKSQQYIASLNDVHSHRRILSDFKTTLPEIRQSYPLMELINRGANKGHLEAIVTLLVMKAENMITSQGNLRQGHALEIAKNIISDYPLLSLEDINLLLMNGVKGKYGQIYRLDISVIYEWIRQFEEEKAEDREVVLKKVKPNLDQVGNLSPETEKMVNDWLANLKGIKPVPARIKAYEEPIKPKSLSSNYIFNEEADRIQDLKIQYGRLHADPYTGRTLENHPTFEEFLAEHRKKM